MVKTRFAPSPTGYLHIGGARTALFSWLYARRHQGQFLLRIEDTDRERSTQASIDAIIDSMAWLGLEADEPPIFQSQRFDRYRQVIQQLLDDGHAYHCYCTKEELDDLREQQQKRGEKPRYDGRYRDYQGSPRPGVEPVVRFKNPLTGDVTYQDLVYGPIVTANAELDDLIIARSDGTPTYNFCVVVDDWDMAITHVIRGDDHINNTPRQINIYHALGATPPAFAHVPMILGDDGARLSKRHGAASVTQYRDEGYLSEALLNYLVRLGWSHGDQEVFNRSEMIQYFDLKEVNRAAAKFNSEKLKWLNQHYLKNAEPSTLVPLLFEQLQALNIDPSTGASLPKVLAAFSERAQTLAEIADQAAFLYRDFGDYEAEAVATHFTIKAKAPLQQLLASFSALTDAIDWHEDKLQKIIKETAKAQGLKMGQVGMPLRLALCGRTASPSLGVTLELLGRAKTLDRLERAIAFIDAHTPTS